MEFINATRLAAAYNVGLEPNGREMLVVVIKGTFVMPKANERMQLSNHQLPLVMSDTFTGAPGYSAPMKEIDFACRKAACDVLLAGCAYAPDGFQVTRQRVSLRVGQLQKSFDVFGDRVWQASWSGFSASAPLPFTKMPISYDRAFGGADRGGNDEAEPDAYPTNPIGRGWHKHLKAAWVDGKPLPNTEAVGKFVREPNGSYEPMAFGPVGRNWRQRACYAGSYDAQWLEDAFPHLPSDFDDRYYQSAPGDQQIPIPTAPLEVRLCGLNADGARNFTIPHFEAPVHMWTKRGQHVCHIAQLDTIVIDPDENHVSLTWRTSQSLRRGIHEMALVVAGRQGGSRWPLPEPKPVSIPIVSAYPTASACQP